MATQIQVRGAATATQEARTLISRELDVDTTENRLNIHNGSTAGGTPHVNYKDQQNQEFMYAAASGTNALTMSCERAPAAYQAGQRFVFKAAATNTGSVTLDVDSLGAKTVKKKDVFGGTLATLDAGDLIQDGVYSVQYNGTDMILESVDSGGIQSVSQGDLNVSTGTVATTLDSAKLTLPGGQYGFFPQNVQSIANIESWANIIGSFSGAISSASTNGANHGTSDTSATHPGTSYATTICAGTRTGTLTFRQTYIASSPPFDMGDGEVGGFIFALVNNAGDILSTYAADVPPWAYNGPTNIRADEYNRSTGKKYRYVTEDLTFEQIMDGVKPKMVKQEITHAIKNADMGLIPHPFGDVRPNHTVVLLDCMCDRLKTMIYMQNGGWNELSNLLINGDIRIDNTELSRKGPKGVKQYKFSKR